MADYGHELAFGTFVTPRNEHPDKVVDLARLTKKAGLDLVTFQDHPYQSTFLAPLALASPLQRRWHTHPTRPPTIRLLVKFARTSAPWRQRAMNDPKAKLLAPSSQELISVPHRATNGIRAS
jgi:hypothetical protein